ncbi:3'-5' exonuclease DinG [Anaerolineae bacterium]|nr:3'-5' exonuclease DinG [Anaerolineae bacterium]
MNPLLQPHILGWLRSLQLPDPEFNYALGSFVLDIAYPEDYFGIRIDDHKSVDEVDGWTIWRCQDEQQVYEALVEISTRLGNAPVYHPVELESIAHMREQGLFDAALETIEEVESGITKEHPDYQKLRDLKRRIRQERRELETNQAVLPTQDTRTIGFVDVLTQDAKRYSSDYPDYNLFGFFSPQPSVVEAVDSVWAMSVRDGQASVWAAAVAGQLAAQLDPSFEISPTEVDLLFVLLQQLEGVTTFIWDSSQTKPSLHSWHYRSTGRDLPVSDQFIDLRAICLIAFPTARRTDRPESLCQELSVSYFDNNGQGSVAAAMNALLNACHEEFATMDTRLIYALRNVLRTTTFRGIWLDALIPQASTDHNNDDYIHLLSEYYGDLLPPMQSSRGGRDTEEVAIEDFFREGGYLAQISTGNYQVREGQVALSAKVDNALRDTRPYLLEAGTGVGKTLGYLIPLLLNEKRGYVSTHTKNLQDQAWNKDIPTALRALERAGIERTVSILKGKTNYFSPQLLQDALGDLSALTGGNDEKAFALAAVLHWAVSTKTGYLSEVESIGHQSLIHGFSREKASPTGDDIWSTRDPYRRAVDAAQTADLVLLNHSLVFALAKQGQPDHDEIGAIVFDEAHNIEDVATQALTLDFDAWLLQAEIASLLRRDASKRVRGLLEAILENEELDADFRVSAFRTALYDFEVGLGNWCQQANMRFIKLGENRRDQDDETPLVFEIGDFWNDVVRLQTDQLAISLEDLIDSLRPLVEQSQNISNIPKRLQSRLLGGLLSLLEHLQDAQAALRALSEMSTELVFWGEANLLIPATSQQILFAESEEWRGVLHVTPLNVADWLEKTLPALYTNRVYLSATLAVSGSFETAISRLGLSVEETVSSVFPSPFNYRQQALMVIPTDLPYPQAADDASYVEPLTAYIAELTKISDGRALVLFTSRRMLNEVEPRLQAALFDSGHNVIAQNPHNRSAIVERFRNARTSGEKLVLLGLRSFWEGVDFPNTLKLLVITRLPFDYFGHPVSAARRAYYLTQGFDRDYFHDVVIPTTLLHLRQMVGRLIRTETDYGVCIIADPRIQSTHYGRFMLTQLLDSQRAVGRHDVVLEQVRQFLTDPANVDEVIDLTPMVESGQTLSLEQQSIVTSQAQRMIIEATAGSGKTRALVERIVALIQSGRARPEQMLILTFTNKARDVMLARLETSLDPLAFLTISRNVLTYHRLAARVIRSVQLDELTFLNERPEEQTEIIGYARRIVGISNDELSDEDALAAISFAQNGLIDENELNDLRSGTQSFLAKIAELFAEYVRQLRNRHLLDYGEAIVHAVGMLRENTAIRQQWSSRFKWIFCDEYQDTTPAQSTLINLIGQHADLLVVGDSAQSIYAWQGADPDNLTRFGVDFPGAANFSLSTNYRCFPNLVRTAETFLQNVGQISDRIIRFDDRRERELTRVQFVSMPSVTVEAEAIVNTVQRIFLENRSESNNHTVGVLARKWSLLGAIEEACIRLHVPYQFEGTTSRGIASNPDVETLIKRAAQLVTEARSNVQTGDSAHGRAVSDVRSGNVADAAQLIRRAVEVLGKQFEEQDAAIGRLLTLSSGLPLEHFMRIFEHIYNTESNTPALVLSTIHSQKGEEFDTVFVTGLEVGNTPNKPPHRNDQMLSWRQYVQQHSRATWRASLSHSQLERAFEQEEERLFYVAITRAKHSLIVSSCDDRGKPSPFLDAAFSKNAGERLSDFSGVRIWDGESHVEGEYRPDGRRYLTNAGIYVRSKSEMLLANELSRRGIYFEYEEPLMSIPNALPDFTFPDYGGVILEHLGMLDNQRYQQRWESKAQLYRAKGVQFFYTTEDDIRHLQTTVEDLRDQFLLLISNPHRVRMIELIEQLRQRSEINIGRAIGDIKDGLLRINEHPLYIAVRIAVSDELDYPSIDRLDGRAVSWQRLEVAGMSTWVAVPR